jgi:hypothetical protein
VRRRRLLAKEERVLGFKQKKNSGFWLENQLKNVNQNQVIMVATVNRPERVRMLKRKREQSMLVLHLDPSLIQIGMACLDKTHKLSCRSFSKKINFHL